VIEPTVSTKISITVDKNPIKKSLYELAI